MTNPPMTIMVFPAEKPGPGYPLIRLQALGAGPVSVTIPNTASEPGRNGSWDLRTFRISPAFLFGNIRYI